MKVPLGLSKKQPYAPMKGKICLITGVMTGAGLEIAKGFARQGAQVVITESLSSRCIRVIRQIRQETSNSAVTGLETALISQWEVRKLAIRYKNSYPRLDVLVNNAGGFFPEPHTTTDGIELNFAVNYLNHFLLTHLLFNMLIASGPSRVINIASPVYARWRNHNEDWQSLDDYDPVQAYERSKRASWLFSCELARRVKEQHVSVHDFDPGSIPAGLPAGPDDPKAAQQLWELSQRLTHVRESI
jgi:NAD(P)-dependent dehydrogenase (short-subunit alcohol dehydrogenase family)